MEDLYQAEYSFNGMRNERISAENCDTFSTRSTPTSPNASRSIEQQKGASTRSLHSNVLADTVLRSPILKMKLEKCISEPNVYNRVSCVKQSVDDDNDHSPSEECDHSQSSTSTAESKSSRETQSSSLFPTFRKGDLFQVLSKDENPHWWAVRALSADRIGEGFVPACYLSEMDGGITTTNLPLVSPELKLVALSELRSRLAHSAHNGGVFPDPTMIPEPELCPGDDLEKRNRRNQGPPAPPLPPLSAEGLILPRKPPNPCLESAGHKNLHRELLFNQKMGKNVLNQKSELQKAFGKHREQQVRKELEQQRASTKSDLARMVEERARRMDLLGKGEEEPEKCSENEPEFLKVHAKMRARMDSK